MYVCMYVCMHACIYVCMYVCMYARMHTYIHTYTHACMHACIHACIHACMYECMHICTHACMHARTHARTHAPQLSGRGDSCRQQSLAPQRLSARACTMLKKKNETPAYTHTKLNTYTMLSVTLGRTHTGKRYLKVVKDI